MTDMPGLFLAATDTRSSHCPACQLLSGQAAVDDVFSAGNERRFV